MKILIVRPHASILTTTSYNMQELGLAKAYVKAGHQADIVLYGGREADHLVSVETGASIINIYYLKGFGIAKNAFFYSLKKMVDDYDIIQVHEYDQITSWLYYASKKYCDKVIMYHGPYYSDFNRGYNLRCKIFDNIFLKLRSNYDVPCFTKSNAAAEFLKAKGFKHVTPVGVGLDTDGWKDAAGNGTSVDEGCGTAVTDETEVAVDSESASKTFTYLYVGKIEPRRNTLFLLDVVDKLLSAHDDMRFILVGNGEEDYKSQCMAKAQKWIDVGRMTYVPKASQSEMPSFYAQADCMLFPSIYEIFGMVLMEAIYFGVPVVTSNNGGADMLFQNGVNSIVIDCNSDGVERDSVARGFDLDEWVEAAERMYSDVKFSESIKGHLLKDRERLSWDDIAEKILNSIEKDRD